MKEISLKKPAEKQTKETMAMPAPRDSYPSFTVYDYASDELMKIPMGQEVTAKIRKSSEDTHKGDKSRNTCGFEVLSIMVKDEEKIKGLMDKHKLSKEDQESVLKNYKG